MLSRRHRAFTRPVLLLTIVTAGIANTTTPAMAQSAQARQGFSFSAGVGYGSLGLGCELCASLDREGGANVYLSAGAALSHEVRLGVDLNSWLRSGEGGSGTLSSLMATAQVYPKLVQGVFLKGGLGYSALFGDFNSISQDTATEGGLGLLLGAGYDIRIGQNTSLTPNVSYLRGSFGGDHADVIQAGLGLTFH